MLCDFFQLVFSLSLTELVRILCSKHIKPKSADNQLHAMRINEHHIHDAWDECLHIETADVVLIDTLIAGASVHCINQFYRHHMELHLLSSHAGSAPQICYKGFVVSVIGGCFDTKRKDLS
jgi:hypothetical protein